jgi:hypothetical protein
MSADLGTALSRNIGSYTGERSFSVAATPTPHPQNVGNR